MNQTNPKSRKGKTLGLPDEKFHILRSEGWRTDLATMWFCPICGGMVGDVLTHYRWHHGRNVGES